MICLLYYSGILPQVFGKVKCYFAVFNEEWRGKDNATGKCRWHKQILAYVVRIGLAKKRDAVDKPANAEKTKCKQIQNAHTGFSFIELMSTQISKEETQKKCYPFVSDSDTKHSGIYIGVGIGVCVGIIDDDTGLFVFCHILYLATAMCANDGSHRDFCAAVFTKLCVFLCSGVVFGLSVTIHLSFLSFSFCNSSVGKCKEVIPIGYTKRTILLVIIYV